MKGRILLATDGAPQSLGAVRVAAALAERDGCEVEVLTVLEPPSAYAAGHAFAVPVPIPGPDGLQAEGLRSEVEAQLRAAGGAAAAWPVRVELGAPARTIAACAEERGAALIVLGLGRHDAVDRWFGRETALDVVRLAHVPVLAVPAEAAGTPRTALAATDFSPFSLDAAGRAAELLGPDGELHVAHAGMEAPREAAGGAEWLRTYEAGARERLEQVSRGVAGACHVRVRPHLLRGEPAAALLSFAERTGVELVAAGSHGYGFFTRILMGSVSTRLLRGARCMVLVAPPQGVPGEPRGVPEHAAAEA
jgi:nucleotide-binding universal stress UspA family protein